MVQVAMGFIDDAPTPEKEAFYHRDTADGNRGQGIRPDTVTSHLNADVMLLDLC